MRLWSWRVAPWVRDPQAWCYECCVQSRWQDPRLASGSYDGTLRLWEVVTARCLAILLPSREGWVAFTPDGRYKLGGDIAGAFWHVIGLCRFEPGELDPYLPLRIPDREPLLLPA